jgi:uncharacterized protein (TIGR02246 family)
MNPDDDAIRAVVRQWERAWNAGDMSSAATLFCDDADFVNVWGSHWHGRGQIEDEHVKRHRLQLKDSVFAPLEVGVQHIGVKMALVHVRWTIHGDHDLDGRPRDPRQGLFSWIMMRDGEGHWRIRAAHNTHVATAP